jgi:lysophospholipid acyltransferase (LPLAT)-like uncharacterized protein
VKGKFSFGQRLLLLVASLIGTTLLRLYGMTWRVRWDGVDDLAKAKAKYGQVLFCFWHSRLLSLCYTHRYRNIGIMVSQSFDGEWMSGIATKLGYRVFRGSASRDGAKALISMLRSTGGDLSLTVDGPRGPAEKVKPGIVALALHSNLPLVPITCVAEKAWRLKSWDRFIIPKPFSKVTVRYGEMVPIPDDLDEDQLGVITKKIEDGINRIG